SRTCTAQSSRAGASDDPRFLPFPNLRPTPLQSRSPILGTHDRDPRPRPQTHPPATAPRPAPVRRLVPSTDRRELERPARRLEGAARLPGGHLLLRGRPEARRRRFLPPRVALVH